MTSHDVVGAVRRRFGTKAVGHTGTLDPFATGLLVLVIGRATRLARFVEATDKVYAATACLGVRTDTDDATGEPLGPAHEGPWPSRDEVERTLATLVGEQEQVPPAFSAKKVAGRRSYALARQGVATELAPVPVTVHGLELVAYEPPMVGFLSRVGPGTYVRAIGRDLGARLGTGAHLTALRRERVGAFDVGRAARLDALTGREQLLAPLELVAELPTVELTADDVGAIGHGRAVGSEVAQGARAALVADGRLIAVAEERGGRWQPVVVLATDE
jgi:tRNA pseudouridine55 synthase